MVGEPKCRRLTGGSGIAEFYHDMDTCDGWLADQQSEPALRLLDTEEADIIAEPFIVQPPPLQPVKVDPPSAVAVRVTVVLLKKLKLQVAPHSIPVGAETTFPVPVPSLKISTVNVPGGGNTLNVAVTVTVLAT